MSLKEFVKIAVGLREHPKVLQAGDDAGWLFVCSIMWSKEHDTDGTIPGYVVDRLNGYTGRRLTAAVKGCVDGGLWEQVEGGYRVHDYLDHQESAEERRGKRQAASVAGRKGAAKRWGSEPHSEPYGGPHKAPHGVGIAEEEKEKRKTPPDPPTGGRDRDRLSYELEFNTWVAENFPGVQPTLVEYFVGHLRGRRIQPTVENVRALVEEHDAKNRSAREQLEAARKEAA